MTQAGSALSRALLGGLGLRAAAPPGQIHLSVTDRCFLPCLHCDIYKNEAEDLPTSEWLSVLDQLGGWLGTASVNFVGGEPLLRKDLEQLMGRATQLGFAVTFNTNGWLLNATRARGLRDAGASVAYVSLDGARTETVDHSRGRTGSFRKALDACDHLDAVGRPRVILSCVLHGKNAAEIPLLLELARSRGYELVVQPLYQSFGENAHDPGWWRRSPLWPTSEELPLIDMALDVLSAERRAAGRVCNSVEQLEAFKAYFRGPHLANGQVCKAGHSDLAFDPAGKVRLCYFLEPVGHLHEPLPEIWNRVRTMRRRHEVSRCQRSCNLLNCNFKA